MTTALIVKARKNHHCSVCERRIHEGAQYIRERVFSVDGIGVWKAHKRCEKAYWNLPDYWRDGNDGWVDAYEFRIEMMYQRYPILMEAIMKRKDDALNAARRLAGVS